jgi:hypothetical protein
MHDIDSTRLEASPDYNELEDHQEFTSPESQESNNGEGEESFEMPMSEVEEEALAAELLGVSSEYEMEQFLGGLFRKIKRRLGGAAKFLSQNAVPLAGALQGIAAKAIPSIAGAMGAAVPIPGLNAVVSSALTKATSNLLQSEMEDLEGEEQEFERSKRFVQFATQAIRQAGRINGGGNPSAAANAALRDAFRRLRGSGGLRPQPIYVRCAPCPPPEPCPSCPTCSQALPAADSPEAVSGHGPANAEPSSNAGQSTGRTAVEGAGASGESEYEDTGEYEQTDESEDTSEYEDIGELERNGDFENADQGESENYENDNEVPAASAPISGSTGRWVRRGGKIVLYGI